MSSAAPEAESKSRDWGSRLQGAVLSLVLLAVFGASLLGPLKAVAGAGSGGALVEPPVSALTGQAPSLKPILDQTVEFGDDPVVVRIEGQAKPGVRLEFKVERLPDGPLLDGWEVVLPGDVDRDGARSSVDAALILQKEAGLISLEEGVGDVNGDDLTTSVDAALVLQDGADLAQLNVVALQGLANEVDTSTYEARASYVAGDEEFTASEIFTITVTDVQPPAAPTNLEAELVPGPAVELTWEDNATNEDGFTIFGVGYDSSGEPVYILEPNLPGADRTSYTDTELVLVDNVVRADYSAASYRDGAFGEVYSPQSNTVTVWFVPAPAATEAAAAAKAPEAATTTSSAARAVLDADLPGVRARPVRRQARPARDRDLSGPGLGISRGPDGYSFSESMYRNQTGFESKKAFAAHLEEHPPQAMEYGKVLTARVNLLGEVHDGQMDQELTQHMAELTDAGITVLALEAFSVDEQAQINDYLAGRSEAIFETIERLARSADQPELFEFLPALLRAAKREDIAVWALELPRDKARAAFRLFYGLRLADQEAARQKRDERIRRMADRLALAAKHGKVLALVGWNHARRTRADELPQRLERRRVVDVVSVRVPAQYMDRYWIADQGLAEERFLVQYPSGADWGWLMAIPVREPVARPTEAVQPAQRALPFEAPELGVRHQAGTEETPAPPPSRPLQAGWGPGTPAADQPVGPRAISELDAEVVQLEAQGRFWEAIRRIHLLIEEVSQEQVRELRGRLHQQVRRLAERKRERLEELVNEALSANGEGALRGGPQFELVALSEIHSILLEHERQVAQRKQTLDVEDPQRAGTPEEVHPIEVSYLASTNGDTYLGFEIPTPEQLADPFAVTQTSTLQRVPGRPGGAEFVLTETREGVARVLWDQELVRILRNAGFEAIGFGMTSKEVLASGLSADALHARRQRGEPVPFGPFRHIEAYLRDGIRRMLEATGERISEGRVDLYTEQALNILADWFERRASTDFGLRLVAGTIGLRVVSRRQKQERLTSLARTYRSALTSPRIMKSFDPDLGLPSYFGGAVEGSADAGGRAGPLGMIPWVADAVSWLGRRLGWRDETVAGIVSVIEEAGRAGLMTALFFGLSQVVGDVHDAFIWTVASVIVASIFPLVHWGNLLYWRGGHLERTPPKPGDRIRLAITGVFFQVTFLATLLLFTAPFLSGPLPLWLAIPIATAFSGYHHARYNLDDRVGKSKRPLAMAGGAGQSETNETLVRAEELITELNQYAEAPNLLGRVLYRVAKFLSELPGPDLDVAGGLVEAVRQRAGQLATAHTTIEAEVPDEPETWLQQWRAVVGDEAVDELLGERSRLQALLDELGGRPTEELPRFGRTNATKALGGVSELLMGLIPLAESIGLEARWTVPFELRDFINAGSVDSRVSRPLALALGLDPDSTAPDASKYPSRYNAVLRFTKVIHHGIQNNLTIELGDFWAPEAQSEKRDPMWDDESLRDAVWEEAWQLFHEVVTDLGVVLLPMYAQQDVIVIDDPQVAPLIPMLRAFNREAVIIARLHIDLSNPRPKFWQRLQPYLNEADLVVVHSPD
ncbi:MAG: ChaN family lipoprotein, partial [Candidatus Omnitrophota bacterium]|nr:ChaN family lipoprotein [Candidatus Omnitrophota bacterium]